MAGPLFLAVVSLEGKASQVSVSRRVALVAGRHGLGIIFGAEAIRGLLREDAEILDELTKGDSEPLAFMVTSNPLATDLMETFEEQLNPWAGADASKADFLRFLDEVWEDGAIRQVSVALWESMIPSARDMPRHEMRFPEFRGWIRDYYRRELERTGHGGAQGIFRILK